MDENRLIGRRNQLPWYLPGDLAYFKQMTLHKSIIMGRKTYASIGKPLPHRRNIVITRSDLKIRHCEVVGSFESALTLTQDESEVMVIGGLSVYTQALPIVQRIYLTQIHHTFSGDTYFPAFNQYTTDQENWQVTREKHYHADQCNQYAYTFTILERIHGENRH